MTDEQPSQQELRDIFIQGFTEWWERRIPEYPPSDKVMERVKWAAHAYVTDRPDATEEDAYMAGAGYQPPDEYGDHLPTVPS